MRSSVPTAFLLLAALLVTAAPPVGAHTTDPPASSPVAPSGVPFAVRAGYVAARTGEVVGLHTAEALLTVDVVFVPRTDTAGSTARGASDRPVRPAAVALDLGRTAGELSAAEAYFASFGLTTRPFVHDRLGLELVGTAPQMGQAFGTELLAGLQGSHPVVFPATPPSLPGWLETEVAGVVGLAAGFDAFSFDLAPSGRSGTGGSPSLLASPITPSQARAVYGYSQLYNLSGGPANASGHAIAVLLWGAGYRPSDLATFFSAYYPASFPQPVVTPYPVNGAPSPSESAGGSPDSRAVEELTLDIEWSASMAPGATIDAVYTHDGPPPEYGPSVANLTTALETALSLSNTTNLTAISMSFGSPASNDAALVSAWGPLLSEADRMGITLLAATGDTGGDASVPCSGGPSPQYPSSADDVIAVGGTDLTITSPVAPPTSFSESAWPNGGGGFALGGSPPSWQLVGSAAGPIGAAGHRGMPDVSAASADDFVYYNGSATSAGGTSFATPIWAGLVADLDAKWGHRLGFFTDRLYHIGSVEPSGEIGAGLVDVVGGGNCIANAVAGWDAATGWGTPRAAVLYADLLGSFVHLALTVQPDPAPPGGSIAVTVVLTNRTSGVPLSAVPVAVSVASDLPGGPCAGTLSSAVPVSNATGIAQASLRIPFCYVGTHAVVTVAVTTVHYYGTNSSKVAVNLLGWFPRLAFLDTAPWEYVTYAAIMAAAVAGGLLLSRYVGPTVVRPPPPAAPPRPAPEEARTPSPPAPPPAGTAARVETSAEGPSPAGENASDAPAEAGEGATGPSGE